MDRLKALADICIPDLRQTNWVILNSEDGSTRPLTLNDHHASIEQIVPDPRVPEDIRQHTDPRDLVVEIFAGSKHYRYGGGAGGTTLGGL
jgi:hypothetical protein